MASGPEPEPTTSVDNTQPDDVIVALPNGVGIRGLRKSDAPRFGHHANNKKIWNNLRNRMPHPYSEADAHWFIDFSGSQDNWVRSGAWAEATGSQGPARRTLFAVTVDDEAVGSIGLEFGQDIYVRSAEIGYWLSEEHWGKGVMGAAVPALVDWAWKNFEILARIHAEVYESNLGSRRTLEKSGFVIEGRKKMAVWKNGEFLNAVSYALLRPGLE